MSLARGLLEVSELQHSPSIEPIVATQTGAGSFDDGELPFQVIRKPSFARLLSLVRGSDLVHVAGPALAPMLASYILGKSFVIEHHNYQSICPNGLLILHPRRSICPGYFRARKYGQCLSCRAIETASWKAALSLVAMFPRRFLSRRALVNIGVSQHVVNRIALPNSLAIYHGVADPPLASVSAAVPTIFAFVGRFVPEKGVPVLLRASTILRSKCADFRVRLIGDGPERRSIEEMISFLKLEGVVEIMGFRSGPGLEEALADVGALVMPSVWEETAGLSAMEHMMRGRLVIASSVAGLAEMLGEAGLLSTVESPESVADCMFRVIQNPDLAGTLGRKARERALRLFSRTRMIEDHIKIYSSLLADNPEASCEYHWETGTKQRADRKERQRQVQSHAAKPE